MYTKFHLKISMYDRENERKLNPEGQKCVTLYAPAISWRGHKKFQNNLTSKLLVCERRSRHSKE